MRRGGDGEEKEEKEEEAAAGCLYRACEKPFNLLLCQKPPIFKCQPVALFHVPSLAPLMKIEVSDISAQFLELAPIVARVGPQQLLRASPIMLVETKFLPPLHRWQTSCQPKHCHGQQRARLFKRRCACVPSNCGRMFDPPVFSEAFRETTAADTQTSGVWMFDWHALVLRVSRACK